MLLGNKKEGQVAETVTWLVATIAIFIILSISVYTASVLSKTNRDVTISVEDSPILLKKSLYGFLLTEDTSGKKVFEQIEDDGDLNKINRVLEKKIFIDPFGKFNFRLLVDSFSPLSSPYEEFRISKDFVLEVFLKER